MAEPNVTIISASIPILRGFVRNIRKGTTSGSHPAGAYIRTDDNSHTIYGPHSSNRTRSNTNNIDTESDTSILRCANTLNSTGHFNDENYGKDSSRQGEEHRGKATHNGVEEIEMDSITLRTG